MPAFHSQRLEQKGQVVESTCCTDGHLAWGAAENLDNQAGVAMDRPLIKTKETGVGRVLLAIILGMKLMSPAVIITFVFMCPLFYFKISGINGDVNHNFFFEAASTKVLHTSYTFLLFVFCLPS